MELLWLIVVVALLAIALYLFFSWRLGVIVERLQKQQLDRYMSETIEGTIHYISESLDYIEQKMEVHYRLVQRAEELERELRRREEELDSLRAEISATPSGNSSAGPKSKKSAKKSSAKKSAKQSDENRDMNHHNETARSAVESHASDRLHRAAAASPSFSLSPKTEIDSSALIEDEELFLRIFNESGSDHYDSRREEGGTGADEIWRGGELSRSLDKSRFSATAKSEPPLLQRLTTGAASLFVNFREQIRPVESAKPQPQPQFARQAIPEAQPETTAVELPAAIEFELPEPVEPMSGARSVEDPSRFERELAREQERIVAEIDSMLNGSRLTRAEQIRLLLDHNWLSERIAERLGCSMGEVELVASLPRPTTPRRRLRNPAPPINP